MGVGGIRGSCRATLLILAGIVFVLAILCAIVGGILYGTSKGFTAMAHAHAAKNSSGHMMLDLDKKFDSIRNDSQNIADRTHKAAMSLFIVAGVLGGLSLLLLVLSCRVGSRPSAPLAPPIVAPPGSYPTRETEPPTAGTPPPPAAFPTPPPSAVSPTPPPHAVSPTLPPPASSPTPPPPAASPTPPPDASPTPPSARSQGGGSPMFPAIPSSEASG